MPKPSRTDHVRKRCACAKWKTCSHPWYLDAQHTVREGPTKTRVRFRDNLDKLTGRHAADFAEAKVEAQRAILAKLEGRDPKDLAPEDDPTLAELLEAFDREKPRADRWQIGKLLATPMRSATGLRPFGEWRLSAITTETLKDFRRGRPTVAGNRDLALLRAAFNMAVVNRLVARSPFRVGDVSVVKLTAERGRTRRLHPGEEERLLLAASGTLHDIIIAALETGCRKGELLSLQWEQVRFQPRAEIFLPAQKTKSKKDRRVPISTVLVGLLERRRRDPAGDLLPPDAYVFGDEIGRRRGDIDRAWETAVLKAHGHRPIWRRSTSQSSSATLAPASRQALAAINLHFHDLRREAGSRWMDAGVPLGTIQRWLGHFNISQTSTYLGASIGGDEQDMRAFEATIGRTPPKADPPISDDFVTQNDAKSRSTGPKRDRSTPTAIKNARENTTIH